MKKLLILVAAASLFVPVLLYAAPPQNAHPALFLDIYSFKPKPSTLPAYICTHDIGVPAVQCYAGPLKPAGSWGYVIIHVCKLDPIPPGGFIAVYFGMEASGVELPDFISVNACPGWLKAPSTAGEPMATGFASIGGICRDWTYHPGYVLWNDTWGSVPTNATYFDIVNSADLLHHNISNCLNEYDPTTIGGRAQWGADKTIQCEGSTAVELTTWGKIKGLYR
jgi:hypothetical protein